MIMKTLTKFSRAIFAIAMMLCVAFPALAHDFEVDGIYYNYIDESSKTVEVTYKGSGYNSYTNEYTGSVIIPSSVFYSGTTYSVTSIGDCAFRRCTGLTSVTIPNSVTAIGSSAFEGCTGLTSVTIPNSVTSIGSWSFAYCTGLISVTIPNSVTEIGYSAFFNCTDLTEVNISDLSAWCKIVFRDSVANPLSYATKLKLNGTEIKGLVIPNDITKIKNYAFSGCSGLTTVTIPNSVTEIGSEAFSGCSGLTTVTIPNSVTTIGSEAFSGCSSLTTVTIGNSVTEIGSKAFSGCSGLITVTIPNSVTTIGDYAFDNCIGLTSVTIPNSVTEIGSEAFSGCSGLTTVTIPNSVTTIGYSAFAYCTGLTSVTIGNSVTSIGSYAFYNCTSLTEVVIGKSVKSIGGEAFEFVSDLKTIISLNPTPPTCASSRTFYSSNYTNSTLYVPKDSYAKYFINDEWGKFKNIKKIETLVSSIKLNNTSIELDKGSTATLTATITPSNATINDVVWESSNPQVAKVDQSGIVTALSAGIATITAKSIDGTNVSASCNVVVNSVETKITLSQTEAIMLVNDIITLTYSVTPSIVSVEWSTSNQNVAYIKKNTDNSLTVLGMADGEAIIIAKATDGSGASASCKVIVGIGGVDGVEVDEKSIEVSRYDIHGRLLTEPTKGINILKMSNGSTRKEIVK